MNIRPETNWTNMIWEENCKQLGKNKNMQKKKRKTKQMQTKCQSDQGQLDKDDFKKKTNAKGNKKNQT